MDPFSVYKVFLIATCVSALWKRILDFIFKDCGYKLPALPPYIQALQIYKNPRLPVWMYPIQWVCFTIVRNTKFCITRGTLLWTIVFVAFLPESKANMKITLAKTVKYQFIPPLLLTSANIVEVGSHVLKYYVLKLCLKFRNYLCQL